MVKVLVEQKHPCHGCRWLQLDCELFNSGMIEDCTNFEWDCTDFEWD